ncbi:MAG: hypothetical protein PHG76_11235 [Eubacteriales bacterium]|nr:hypothetical protein [Eubacteriales bacterium]
MIGDLQCKTGFAFTRPGAQKGYTGIEPAIQHRVQGMETGTQRRICAMVQNQLLKLIGHAARDICRLYGWLRLNRLGNERGIHLFIELLFWQRADQLNRR